MNDSLLCMTETIYCLRCETAKPTDEYYPSDLRNGSKRCKQCRNDVQRQRWQKCKQLVDELKDTDCPECGLKWPPECMEFDHTDPSKKDICLSRIVASGSMPRLQAELAKGEFVCSNCHRIRTKVWKYRTGMKGRGKPGEWLQHWRNENE